MTAELSPDPHNERNYDMNKRIVLLLLTMVLALSFTLAACGDNTQGASPDSATADSASKDSSAASSFAASSSVSSQADDQDNASPAPAADNNSANDSNNSGNNNAQDEKSSPAPANNNNNDNGSSQQASSKASSQASSKASSGNPAYKEGEEPSYTIAMTNKSTKKTYSAGCSFSKDDEKLVTTTFFLPGGDYDVAVYAYTEEKDKGDPKATDTFKNSIGEKERKSIRVTYNTETGKIKVEEMKSDRNQ